MDASDSSPAGLSPCTLDELSDNTVVYSHGGLPTSGLPVLTIAISGELSNERDGGYDHAAAMVMAGLEAWDPAAVILDFGGLAYTWGDGMSKVLTAPSRWHAGKGADVELLQLFGERPPILPVGVVCSELCQAGLASLISAYLAGDQPLHTSLAVALSAVDDALASGWGD